VARLSKPQCSAASEGFTLTFYPHALCLSLSLSQQADLDALMATDDSPPAELTDYLSIQPRRTEMVMKWLNEPFLKTALEGKEFLVLVYRFLVLYVSDFRAKPSTRIMQFCLALRVVLPMVSASLTTGVDCRQSYSTHSGSH
jgi:hypothetical protein